MNVPEIALNLWYVRDEDGVIYSLRVRAHVCAGTEAEILTFLENRARLDYHVGTPFPIPDAFHVTVVENGRDVKYPVAHVSMLDLRRPLPMFEEALRIVEDAFPSQTTLKIPEGVLACTTALRQGADGEIEPWITGKMRF